MIRKSGTRFSDKIMRKTDPGALSRLKLRWLRSRGFWRLTYSLLTLPGSPLRRPARTI